MFVCFFSPYKLAVAPNYVFSFWIFELSWCLHPYLVTHAKGGRRNGWQYSESYEMTAHQPLAYPDHPDHFWCIHFFHRDYGERGYARRTRVCMSVLLEILKLSFTKCVCKYNIRETWKNAYWNILNVGLIANMSALDSMETIHIFFNVLYNKSNSAFRSSHSWNNVLFGDKNDSLNIIMKVDVLHDEEFSCLSTYVL